MKFKKAKHNVKTVIRDAMKKVKKNRKLKIVNEMWGCYMDPEKGYFTAAGDEVCALGALLVHKNGSIKFDEFRGKRPLDEIEEEETAAYVLGVDRGWVDDFISGFDHPNDKFLGDTRTAMGKERARAFRIGQELAEEFGLKDDEDDDSCGDAECSTCA